VWDEVWLEDTQRARQVELAEVRCGVEGPAHLDDRLVLRPDARRRFGQKVVP